MILGFKEYFNDGEPTHFINKIYKGIELPINQLVAARLEFKIHSLRADPYNRWKPNMQIQMATGVRTRFYKTFNDNEPQLRTCISIQKVQLCHLNGVLLVGIDGKALRNIYSNSIIRNDGLCKKRFIEWFFPKNASVWEGKIIHWTNFKY